MTPNNTVANWKILIVDDDTDNLDVASQFLGFLGAETQVASSVPDGLAALDAFAPTFILLDLSMPQIDGWEMFKRLKEQPETASIPVIALTAHAMRGDQQRALEVGFTGYITKPFLFDSLVDDIKRCLAQGEIES